MLTGFLSDSQLTYRQSSSLFHARSAHWKKVRRSNWASTAVPGAKSTRKSCARNAKYSASTAGATSDLVVGPGVVVANSSTYFALRFCFSFESALYMDVVRIVSCCCLLCYCLLTIFILVFFYHSLINKALTVFYLQISSQTVLMSKVIAISRMVGRLSSAAEVFRVPPS